MITLIAMIFVGVLGGIVSGLIGIGGGILMVPLLVFIFGLSQKMAQGTTLAMFVLPISLFSVITYYRHGYVDLRVTALLIIGFIVGSLIGAKFAVRVPDVLLTKIFGILIILIGLKMLFSK